MAIQEEMYKAIEQEINRIVEENPDRIIVDCSKAKNVAKMLTELSMENNEAEQLINQYIANIKNICK